jgi:hypothetical protein
MIFEFKAFSRLSFILVFTTEALRMNIACANSAKGDIITVDHLFTTCMPDGAIVESAVNSSQNAVCRQNAKF